MSTPIDPKTLGLSPKTGVIQLNATTIGLVIDRKSRIIMADGKRILLKIGLIKKNRPDQNVVVLTSAPVCSKTRAFLKENTITVHPLKKHL